MYNFTLGRGRECPLEFFKGYKGNFVSDAYGGYEELFRAEAITNIACWTPARRHFKRAQDTDAKAATEVLTLIAPLYKIEQKIKCDNSILIIFGIFFFIAWIPWLARGGMQKWRKY